MPVSSRQVPAIPSRGKQSPSHAGGKRTARARHTRGASRGAANGTHAERRSKTLSHRSPRHALGPFGALKGAPPLLPITKALAPLSSVAGSAHSAMATPRRRRICIRRAIECGAGFALLIVGLWVYFAAAAAVPRNLAGSQRSSTVLASGARGGASIAPPIARAARAASWQIAGDAASTTLRGDGAAAAVAAAEHARSGASDDYDDLLDEVKHDMIAAQKARLDRVFDHAELADQLDVSALHASQREAHRAQAASDARAHPELESAHKRALNAKLVAAKLKVAAHSAAHLYEVSFILFTVTFHANPANNLTCPLIYYNLKTRTSTRPRSARRGRRTQGSGSRWVPTARAQVRLGGGGTAENEGWCEVRGEGH